MFSGRVCDRPGLAAAVLAGIAGTASADPPPAALRPNCEHGQANAWANDPQSDLFHGGKLFLSAHCDTPLRWRRAQAKASVLGSPLVLTTCVALLMVTPLRERLGRSQARD